MEGVRRQYLFIRPYPVRCKASVERAKSSCINLAPGRKASSVMNGHICRSIAPPTSMVLRRKCGNIWNSCEPRLSTHYSDTPSETEDPVLELNSRCCCVHLELCLVVPATFRFEEHTDIGLKAVECSKFGRTAADVSSLVIG